MLYVPLMSLAYTVPLPFPLVLLRISGISSSLVVSPGKASSLEPLDCRKFDLMLSLLRQILVVTLELQA